MSERNEETLATDENPYRSPNSGPLAALGTPDLKDKRNNTGCLALFLLAIPLLNHSGFAMSHAGPYCPLVSAIGLGGFACGAVLGAYVSVKIRQRPWWSSCRWAIYGLIGMCLPSFIIIVLLQRR